MAAMDYWLCDVCNRKLIYGNDSEAVQEDFALFCLPCHNAYEDTLRKTLLVELSDKLMKEITTGYLLVPIKNEVEQVQNNCSLAERAS